MGLYERGKNCFIDYYVHGRRKREKVALFERRQRLPVDN